MDLAMDIAAAMDEVWAQNPGLTGWSWSVQGSPWAATSLGTMTTTLLLAYSSGYSAMLMTFIAQGCPCPTS